MVVTSAMYQQFARTTYRLLAVLPETYKKALAKKYNFMGGKSQENGPLAEK